MNKISIWLISAATICATLYFVFIHLDLNPARKSEYFSEKTGGEKKISFWLDRAWELRGTDMDSALIYAFEAEKLGREVNNRKLISDALNMLGVLKKNMGEFKISLRFYEESLEIRKKIEDKEGVARTYSNIGNVHRYLGEYDIALEYYFKSLSIREELGDQAQLARLNNNIGTFYQTQKEYSKAFDFFEKASKIQAELGDIKELANTLNNIGITHYSLGENEAALKAYLRSLAYKDSLDDFNGMANTYSNLAIIYEEKLDINSALHAYDKSMEIRERLHDKKGISGTSNNIGSLYISQSEFRKALPYLIQSFSLGEEIGMIDYQSLAAENLSLAYAGLGEYREALHYHQTFTALKDSLFNEDKAKEIGRLEATFAAQKEIDAKAAEVRERTLQRNATLVGLALVCLLGFVIIWGYHQRQRAAKQLAAQKEALNAQLMVELLHDQEVENLAALMEGQEQERKRIARDLHDRLGSKLATVRLHINGMESTVANSESEPQFIQSTKLLDEACQEVREIAHNMASGVLTHFGLVAAIREMANTLDSSGQIKVAVHEFAMEGYRMPSSMEIGIYRVIQELISNILKHARATEVNVHLTRFDHGLNLMVEDNGVGFDLLTQQSDQSGMGLQNMKSRLLKMGGTFEIDSAIGRGTTVLMDIPVNLQAAA